MNAVSVPGNATATAATGAAAVKVKITSYKYVIDHPDQKRGEQLMAEALGVADGDAMEGMLRQLATASVSRQKPDAVNLSFMISMIRSIKPRDAVEAMLVAQMVSVHLMTMQGAHRCAIAKNLMQQESAVRALTRLARTFAAQIEALNRHRSNGEPAVTVQNVSVGDGGQAIVGQAIVGNVTQHRSVVLADHGPPPAATDAPTRNHSAGEQGPEEAGQPAPA